MKVYLSGSISDNPNFMKQFVLKQNELEHKGLDVVNPALLNSMLPDDTTYKEYMSMSMEMLKMCDTIYMLKGWKKSKGAKVELEWAKANGMDIILEEM